jgi:MoaA/NifB/PqqE/SkfB family radical SAM enzyme
VRAAARLGFRPIQIQTNGRLLSYMRLVDSLMAAGATEFSPSLHGSTPALHDALTRAPASWEESVQGIRNLVAVGATVVTNSVIVKGNVHDLADLVALLAELGVRQGQLAFVHPVGTAMELFDDVVPRLPDVVPALARAREVARERGMRLVAEAMPRCFLRGMQELCVEEAIPHTTVVDLDGQVADYEAWRTAEGKSHGPPCERCAMRPHCEGPWREYPAAYGWDEFVPFASA